MTSVELLARLAILVSPPCFPLVRYHGAFAARSSWRGRGTPKPPRCGERSPTPKPCHRDARAEEAKAASSASRADTESELGAAAGPGRGSAPRDSHSRRAMAVRAMQSDDAAIAHWQRLLDGELLARASQLDGAVLLRRTYGVDALRCPQCDGRMRPLLRPRP